MRVLIACEYSGVVREAFKRMGHDAWSCDILDTDISGNHIKTDVIQILDDNWDLMIAHPPCTYLCSSGLHWNTRRPGREQLSLEAEDFFMQLYNANIPRIAVENSIGRMSTAFRKPDQIIQPWQYGHPESKATCLWLKNLPLLVPTNILSKQEGARWENQTPSGQNKYGPSVDRWKKRAKTYQGIADAMAEQWGGLDEGHPSRNTRI